MRKTVKFFLLISALVLSLGLASQGRAAVGEFGEFSSKYISKVTVEKHLEERLVSALKRIGGTDKIIVIVNADVETDVKKLDKRRKQAERSAREKEDKKPKLVLPGVPVKKEIGMEKKPEINIAELIPSVINKLIVTVLVDNTISEGMLDVMRDVSISVIGYNPDRGDMLNFRQIVFEKQRFQLAILLHPPYIYWVMVSVFIALFLILASFLVATPFKQLAAAVGNISMDREAAHAASSGEEYKSVAQVELYSPTKEAPEAKSGNEKTPFSFVKSRHVPDLALLLKDSPTEDVAIVVNYLSPETAISLLESFPEDRQAEVALSLSGEGEVKLKEVQELEESIKTRLDYIVGGEDKLASILDFTGEGIRQKIFEAIEGKDADEAARIKSKVKSFKSVMRELSPNGIQALYRQINPTTFAKVLKSSPGDIQGKVLESLSEGAAERLREEMDLSRPFSKERLRKERFNITLLVRRMDKSDMLEDAS